MKTCHQCGFVGEEIHFCKKGFWCKKCRSEYNKKYKENNTDKLKKYHKEYYENNSEYFKKWYELYGKEKYKQRYLENPKKFQNRNLIYRKNNPEYYKQWRQTPSGKEASSRHLSKRRLLGHKPINSWFKGSELHHLRYSKTIKEQDNDITMYVPRKVHRSIFHNGNTGYNMKQINIKCLEWYLETTPKEEQHPKAERLYNNYRTLPEPEWG